MVASRNVPQELRANGWRYPLVGGTRQRHFVGTSFKPRKLLENAKTPTTTVLVLCQGSGARCVSPRELGNPLHLSEEYLGECLNHCYRDDHSQNTSYDATLQNVLRSRTQLVS